MTEKLPLISLGAGVQSSTMALMSAAGDLPMVSGAIFSDTGVEPAGVYKWLDWLESELPYPVHRVNAGSLGEAQTTIVQHATKDVPYLRSIIPAFVKHHDGTMGMLGRRCTRDFKIRPLLRKAKELAAAAGAPGTEQWIGISTDEAHRMKPSGLKWSANRWPLIEAKMSRSDCLRWMEDKGHPEPPRSSCYFCPFHSDDEWERLRDQDPESFELAVQFEKDLQAAAAKDELSGIRGTVWVHRQAIPLRDAVELASRQMDLWGNECEGMCGV